MWRWKGWILRIALTIEFYFISIYSIPSKVAFCSEQKANVPLVWKRNWICKNCARYPKPVIAGYWKMLVYNPRYKTTTEFVLLPHVQTYSSTSFVCIFVYLQAHFSLLLQKWAHSTMICQQGLTVQALLMQLYSNQPPSSTESFDLKLWSLLAESIMAPQSFSLGLLWLVLRNLLKFLKLLNSIKLHHFHIVSGFIAIFPGNSLNKMQASIPCPWFPIQLVHYSTSCSELLISLCIFLSYSVYGCHIDS